MQEQLQLPFHDYPWMLDDVTREIGRRGVDDARRALRRALTQSPGSPHVRAAA